MGMEKEESLDGMDRSVVWISMSDLIIDRGDGL
jgi:hypothetical protein